MEPLLQTKDLICGYHKPLHKPLNLFLNKGESLGVLGVNGIGKSTLIQTLLGFLNPLSGNFEWFHKARFSYLPQQDQLNPLVPLTLDELLNLVDSKSNSPSSFSQKKEWVYQKLKLSHLRSSFIGELSRGQRQRTLMARAFIREPDVFLLDEPLTAIDSAFNTHLYPFFREYSQAKQVSFILVEHDLNQVVNYVDQLLLLGVNQIVYGPVKEVVQADKLSEIFGCQVKVDCHETKIHIRFF